ncbi:hypothetical protein CN234_03110 [Sinorhizobium meliloti]|uniref:hypothetical protein n=1 Tax=Rhizobium meliloti TaxID=382 RepID=UPI000FD8CE2B|nr:hypothetical protein [Sinorhizobium meliloti]RVG14997.1 hypothetical protein CN234_03110 [Sinorhizobium meliloti]
MTEKLTLAQRVVRAVCELGDTTAPEHPDSLLVKAGDLESIIDNHLERWLLTVYDAPQKREEGASTPPAAANSPITPIVNKNGSGTNSETPERTCPNDPKSGSKNWNIAPADTDGAQSEAEAFDTIVAARKAYVDAVAAYNARFEFVRAERERGNWLNVDPEYAAMSEAQSAFYCTVQELADAAIRQRAEEKP